MNTTDTSEAAARFLRRRPAPIAPARVTLGHPAGSTIPMALFKEVFTPGEAASTLPNAAAMRAVAVPDPTPAPSDPAKRDLRDDSIYFIETDRFFDGDKSNDTGVHPGDLNRWQGGDFQGLIDKADYVKSLGVTAVWLSPPMANEDNFMGKYDGYHGYWVENYFSPDKHLGDLAKWKEVVKAFHDRGIKVLVDIPLNDVAYDNPMVKDPKYHDWFHHNGPVTDWNNEWQQQNCDIFGLPDLAQENPQVRNYLMSAAQFWMQTGIDGFRLDAVRSVPQSFWKDFDSTIHQTDGKNKVLLGEYFHGDPNRLVPLQRDADMDSLEDYPLYYAMVDSLAHGTSMRELAGRVAQENSLYPHPENMAAFLDNQDTARFLTEANGDKRNLKLALAFLMTVNRVPILYYGDEQSMASQPGDTFATNRANMDFTHDPDMQGYVQQLTTIRNNCAPLRHGNLLEMWQDDQIYAYDRVSPEGEAIAVLNNDNGGQTRDIPLRAESHLADGTVLKDLLSGRTVTVQNHQIHCALDGKSAMILVKQ
ncbi:MAG: alpha-amylase family glycosyl hydrolase [Candidatus Xenobia bacterium]